MFKNMNRQAVIIGLVIGLFLNEILTLFFGMSQDQANQITGPVNILFVIVLVVIIIIHFRKKNQVPKE